MSYSSLAPPADLAYLKKTLSPGTAIADKQYRSLLAVDTITRTQKHKKEGSKKQQQQQQQKP